ncbi:MAG TPA: hypothetical protein DDW78_09075 [Treponema sp.]|nr:hypothetical protein [Treponema sp.]
MTKEEILDKSRADNGNKDIYDVEVQKKAATAAYFSSFALCVFASLISWLCTRRVSAQCWIVFFGMLSVAFFVKFFKMKKLHELFVALGYLAIFVLLTVLFVFQLTGKIRPAAA